MNKKNAFLILTGILLFVCGSYFIFSEGTTPVPEAKDRAEQPSASQQTTPPPITTQRFENTLNEKKLEFSVYHPKNIQDIKKQIYDLCIEDVDDIPLLDSVVQTGNAPTKDFWMGDWASVDDSKEEVNGFKLEPQDDGTFIFYPDENTTKTYTFFETPKTYTYDPVKKEFYWELDYYGKTISHRARFINNDVLAMMLISGRKVTLDIYQKKSAERE
jgi:hypothetical protein